MEPAARAAPRRRDDLHGDARPALRPRTPSRTVHLFDGRIVEEEEAARKQQESAELKQSGFDVA